MMNMQKFRGLCEGEDYKQSYNFHKWWYSASKKDRQKFQRL